MSPENSLQQRLGELCTGPDWPHIRVLEAAPEHCQLRLDVPPELTWFEGHFPEQPVLAGVVQVHWVGLLSETVFGVATAFSHIDGLKFQRVILPGQSLELQMQYTAERHLVDFRYVDAQFKYSTGKMYFAG